MRGVTIFPEAKDDRAKSRLTKKFTITGAEKQMQSFRGVSVLMSASRENAVIRELSMSVAQ